MERTRDDLRKLGKLLAGLKCLKGLESILKEFSAGKISDLKEEDVDLAYEQALAFYEASELSKNPLQKGERWKYGMRWSPACAEKRDNKTGKVSRIPVRARSDIEIEMRCFLRYEKKAFTPGGLGRYEHCKRGIEMLWHPGARKVCVFNPYAERMFEAFCSDDQFIAFAGHSSGGKTFNPAVWAVWNFLCSPTDTLVIVTSTSLQASRKRIWGDVCNLWNAAKEFFGGDMPGDLLSTGVIRSKVDGIKDEKAGIVLIAGDPKQESENIGRIIGFKASRMFFLCDEMPDLSESLTEAAKTNLRNNAWFQMVGIGNPSKLFDAFGKFCEPAAGWPSVNESDYEWKGVHARVLRFDAANSPNVIAAEEGDYSNPYPGLLKWQDFKAAREERGENNPGFYRMYRAWWCPTGSAESIYWESEIATYGANLSAGMGWHWKNGSTPVWGLDPSFKHGGDDAILTISHVGDDAKTGLPTLERKETIVLGVDVNNALPKDEQVVQGLKKEMNDRGLSIFNGAVDVTGAASFGSLIRREIGDGFIAVEFGGRPSDMPASNTDPRPAHEIYDRMVAELWHVGKELVRNGQIRGLDGTTIKEMVNRSYETKNGKIHVQPKEEMKKALGFSPDRGDSFFLSLHAARRRFKFTSKEKSKPDPLAKPENFHWNQFVEKMSDTSVMTGGDFYYGNS